MLEWLTKNWFPIIVILIQGFMFSVLKFSDLAHLRIEFKEFKNAVWHRIDGHAKDIKEQGENLAELRGYVRGREDEKKERGN